MTTAWKMKAPEPQVGSSGPDKKNTMMPVGLFPPLTIAVSWMAPPTMTDGEAVVVILGVANGSDRDGFGRVTAGGRTGGAVAGVAAVGGHPAVGTCGGGDERRRVGGGTGHDGNRGDNTGVPAQVALSGPNRL